VPRLLPRGAHLVRGAEGAGAEHSGPSRITTDSFFHQLALSKTPAARQNAALYRRPLGNETPVEPYTLPARKLVCMHSVDSGRKHSGSPYRADLIKLWLG
jgi:hypothetical protein